MALHSLLTQSRNYSARYIPIYVTDGYIFFVQFFFILSARRSVVLLHSSYRTSVFVYFPQVVCYETGVTCKLFTVN